MLTLGTVNRRSLAARPQQREIIEAALSGKDVYVQAATSFGKSLCFQLPAVINFGITMVVSPLLSLMMNQVEALQSAGILARSLNSNTPPAERDLIHRDLESGHPRTRLLYVTPELCSGAHFRQRLQLVHSQRELARIAIDEAHCISEWGHDFRKDFRHLSWFRETFPDVPIMCLTATANPRVRADVLSTLGMERDPDRLRCFISTAHRHNLHLEIRYRPADEEGGHRIDDFVAWLQRVYYRRGTEPRLSELADGGERVNSVPGIIYTLSRVECEYLADELRKRGIGAHAFHAKLHPADKAERLARWIGDEPGWDIIVATTAFGMGIDKNNVRFVVHWRVPKSFEGYYQELGRAGRDGNASYCFLYYSREDVYRVQRLLTSDARLAASSGPAHTQSRAHSFEALVRYCESPKQCRHAQICQYFGEDSVPACDRACDFHKEAPIALARRIREGLGTAEEWDASQPYPGTYDEHVEE